MFFVTLVVSLSVSHTLTLTHLLAHSLTHSVSCLLTHSSYCRSLLIVALLLVTPGSTVQSDHGTTVGVI